MAQTATPTRRQCGSMEAHFRLLEVDPNFRRRLIDLEGLTARRMVTGQVRRAAAPTTIPVVVHVLYNSQVENISAGQVRSQMRV